MKNIRQSIIILALAVLPHCAGAQEFAVPTNLADYADLGTLNLEASYGIARHWSLVAGAKYNPFTYNPDSDRTVQKRQRSVSAGARYWPWHIFSGWWLSGAVRYQEYNEGGLSPAAARMTSEGDRFGGSLAVGYTYMLSPKFNIDIGAGVWSGYDIYKTYSCPTCGRKIDEGRRFFILPSDIMLALSYIF